MSFDKKIEATAPYVTIASAKINLALHVTNQSENGYHLLDSLVCFTDFGDRLTIEPEGSAGDLVSLEITGPFAGSLKATQQQELNGNLVTRAAMALAAVHEESGFKCQNVRITLEKNLPVASGIGGGSADAAAALLMLQDFWKNDFSPDLQKIAENLGADVPMCLDPLPKRVRGTGELIIQCPIPVSLPLLLVNPRIPLSTPTVFNALAKKKNLPISIEKDYMNFQSDTLSETTMIQKVAETLSPLRNDLQEPAISLVPEIQRVLLAIERQPGCLLARMSGSGATSFGIYATPALASNALIGIKESNPKWWSVACGTIPTTEDCQK